ncbi:MAG: nucleotide exchange factor GrpE [Candidatus Dormibacteria bacterium]|jgi:molecular chaperone GrpE
MSPTFPLESDLPIEAFEPEPEAGQDGTAEEESEQPADTAQLRSELEQARSSYQRLAADFENYKRRKNQEAQDLARYAAASLLTALLPALDNLARAVAHIDPDARDGLSEGLRLTVRQLEEALASQGVERVEAVGAAFDPRIHDAVSTVPGEGLDRDTVVAELLPGYRLHDRVVRPAQVTVAHAGPPVAGVPEASPDGELGDGPRGDAVKDTSD